MSLRADRPFYIKHDFTTLFIPYATSAIIGMSISLSKTGLCNPHPGDYEFDTKDESQADRSARTLCVLGWSVLMPICVLAATVTIVHIATKRFYERQPSAVTVPLIQRV